MKIICHVIGGPWEGVYESDAGQWDTPVAAGDTIKKWADMTEDFALGECIWLASREEDTVPGVAHNLRKHGHPGHKYQIASVEKAEGVRHVRLEYRGTTSK